MVLELELALRFLRRRTGVLLRGTALAAFGGVMLATTALVVTLALMNGYRQAIAAALQTGNAHVVGFSPRPLAMADANELADALAQVDGVLRTTPVTYLGGMMDDPDEPASPIPVVLKAVGEPPPYTGLEAWADDHEISAVLGSLLASQVQVVPGTAVTVKLPPRGGSWTMPALGLRAVGTFHLSFAEFDERWIVVPLVPVLDALPWAGVAGVEMILADPMAVDAIRPDLEAAAPDLLLTDWRELNGALFAALKWQTLSLFVVLSLVVAVASFQVSSALVVLAIDKRRTTGMLQALGATPASVRRILVLAGTLLGGVGVVGGVCIGWLASSLMTSLRVIRFPPDLARVYMVDHIPLIVDPVHLLAVISVCMALVVGASLWPAWKSSRLDPVTALKAV